MSMMSLTLPPLLPSHSEPDPPPSLPLSLPSSSPSSSSSSSSSPSSLSGPSLPLGDFSSYLEGMRVNTRGLVRHLSRHELAKEALKNHFRTEDRVIDRTPSLSVHHPFVPLLDPLSFSLHLHPHQKTVNALQVMKEARERRKRRQEETRRILATKEEEQKGGIVASLSTETHRHRHVRGGQEDCIENNEEEKEEEKEQLHFIHRHSENKPLHTRRKRHFVEETKRKMAVEMEAENGVTMSPRVFALQRLDNATPQSAYSTSYSSAQIQKKKFKCLTDNEVAKRWRRRAKIHNDNNNDAVTDYPAVAFTRTRQYYETHDLSSDNESTAPASARSQEHNSANAVDDDKKIHQLTSRPESKEEIKDMESRRQSAINRMRSANRCNSVVQFACESNPLFGSNIIFLPNGDTIDRDTLFVSHAAAVAFVSKRLSTSANNRARTYSVNNILSLRALAECAQAPSLTFFQGKDQMLVENWLQGLARKLLVEVLHTPPEMIAAEEKEEAKSFENKLDNASKQVQESQVSNPLKLLMLDRRTLYNTGLTHELIDQLYSGMFAHSLGLFDNIKQFISGAVKDEHEFLLKAWASYLCLVELSAPELHARSIEYVEEDDLVYAQIAWQQHLEDVRLGNQEFKLKRDEAAKLKRRRKEIVDALENSLDQTSEARTTLLTLQRDNRKAEIEAAGFTDEAVALSLDEALEAEKALEIAYQTSGRVREERNLVVNSIRQARLDKELTEMALQDMQNSFVVHEKLKKQLEESYEETHARVSEAEVQASELMSESLTRLLQARKLQASVVQIQSLIKSQQFAINSMMRLGLDNCFDETQIEMLTRELNSSFDNATAYLRQFSYSSENLVFQSLDVDLAHQNFRGIICAAERVDALHPATDKDSQFWGQLSSLWQDSKTSIQSAEAVIKEQTAEANDLSVFLAQLEVQRVRFRQQYRQVYDEHQMYLEVNQQLAEQISRHEKALADTKQQRAETQKKTESLVTKIELSQNICQNIPLEIANLASKAAANEVKQEELDSVEKIKTVMLTSLQDEKQKLDMEHHGLQRALEEITSEIVDLQTQLQNMENEAKPVFLDLDSKLHMYEVDLENKMSERESIWMRMAELDQILWKKHEKARETEAAFSRVHSMLESVAAETDQIRVGLELEREAHGAIRSQMRSMRASMQNRQKIKEELLLDHSRDTKSCLDCKQSALVRLVSSRDQLDHTQQELASASSGNEQMILNNFKRADHWVVQIEARRIQAEKKIHEDCERMSIQTEKTAHSRQLGDKLKERYDEEKCRRDSIASKLEQAVAELHKQQDSNILLQKEEKSLLHLGLEMDKSVPIIQGELDRILALNEEKEPVSITILIQQQLERQAALMIRVAEQEEHHWLMARRTRERWVQHTPAYESSSFDALDTSCKEPHFVQSPYENEQSNPILDLSDVPHKELHRSAFWKRRPSIVATCIWPTGFAPGLESTSRTSTVSTAFNQVSNTSSLSSTQRSERPKSNASSKDNVYHSRQNSLFSNSRHNAAEGETPETPLLHHAEADSLNLFSSCHGVVTLRSEDHSFVPVPQIQGITRTSLHHPPHTSSLRRRVGSVSRTVYQRGGTKAAGKGKHDDNEKGGDTDNFSSYANGTKPTLPPSTKINVLAITDQLPVISQDVEVPDSINSYHRANLETGMSSSFADIVTAAVINKRLVEHENTPDTTKMAAPTIREESFAIDEKKVFKSEENEDESDDLFHGNGMLSQRKSSLDCVDVRLQNLAQMLQSSVLASSSSELILAEDNEQASELDSMPETKDIQIPGEESLSKVQSQDVPELQDTDFSSRMVTSNPLLSDDRKRQILDSLAQTRMGERSGLSLWAPQHDAVMPMGIMKSSHHATRARDAIFMATPLSFGSMSQHSQAINSTAYGEAKESDDVSEIVIPISLVSENKGGPIVRRALLGKHAALAMPDIPMPVYREAEEASIDPPDTVGTPKEVVELNSLCLKIPAPISSISSARLESQVVSPRPAAWTSGYASSGVAVLENLPFVMSKNSPMPVKKRNIVAPMEEIQLGVVPQYIKNSLKRRFGSKH